MFVQETTFTLIQWNNILTLARSYRKIWPDMLRNGGSMYPDGRRPEGLHWPPISRHEGHIFRYDRDRVRIFSLYQVKCGFLNEIWFLLPQNIGLHFSMRTDVCKSQSLLKQTSVHIFQCVPMFARALKNRFTFFNVHRCL